MRPSTWGAAGRATDAAIKVVNAAGRGRLLHEYTGAPHSADCLACLVDRLRQALVDAHTPGVLGGPGQQSPGAESAPPLTPGDPTSGADPANAPTGDGARAGRLGGTPPPAAPDPLSPATAASHPRRAAGAPTERSP